jgi:hypothetical protein
MPSLQSPSGFLQEGKMNSVMVLLFLCFLYFKAVNTFWLPVMSVVVIHPEEVDCNVC